MRNEECSNCAGAGMVLNNIGEPDLCRECRGDGVVEITRRNDVEVEKYFAADTVQVSRKFLEVARCPNIHCTDGAIPHQIGDGEWGIQQCQWCDERKALLAQESEK